MIITLFGVMGRLRLWFLTRIETIRPASHCAGGPLRWKLSRGWGPGFATPRPVYGTRGEWLEKFQEIFGTFR